MQDKESKEFTWSGLFIVTACCSFFFSGIIKLMDGSFSNLLLTNGGVATFFAVANRAVRILAGQSNKKRRKRRFAS